jgi:hypothetical protein
MTAFSSSLLRRAAGACLACAMPFAALAAPAPEAAAAQPQNPRVGSDITSQCKQMSGDERTACERDMHAMAKTQRHGSHATKSAPAASSAG